MTANTHKEVLLIYEPNIAINAVIIKYPIVVPSDIDNEILRTMEGKLPELTIST